MLGQDGWLEADRSWELKKKPLMSCAMKCQLSLGQEQPGRASTAGNGTQQSIACAEMLENDLSMLLASGGAPITPTASLSQKDFIGKHTFGLG